MVNRIQNPILPGFHPDPSIVRVGDDYYIATSTFEWFPGVRIHHSRDLKHWRFVSSPLTRTSQLDMKGNMNSGGIWAPCLSYHDGTFYLIYTDVKQWHGAFKDAHNYLVTAQNIEGPWSDPIYLNSSGFDPSLFHDDDGRKWLVNMIWDYRKGNHPFAGIILQEYSEAEQKLVGPVKNIYKGTDIQLTEGPHLYKKDGYYYLLVAEGGTEYEHAATLARSQSIDGPYETDPSYPLVTSTGQPELALQKAGHGSLVETQNGEWYLAHLCGRPLKGKYCTLGRETAIQKVNWTEDGWLRIEDGGNHPLREVTAPDLPEHPFEKEPELDNFDAPQLHHQWNTLRIPADPSWCSLEERPGHLRLRGMESLTSVHSQSLVARRQQSFHCEVETKLEYQPESFQHMAGLVIYYDTEDHVYLHVTWHEEKGRCLQIIQTKGGNYDELLASPIPLANEKAIYLKGRIHRETMHLYFKQEGETEWQPVGPTIDVTHMSDDSAKQVRFTGTFVGMATQDLSGTKKPADFDYFRYKELDQ
ncbi:glycoside hydrolase family 43 protein [Halalkalibacterium halodurans]|uniref:glycoside hydrolase family 43 protein n=1 Tax=Halalkalibacterium halodurans TaxID=86665 RepID=UPI00106880E0|nr:glycoside hydrolase family 43 protein [Halalkalibacterium halodurans]TES56798.1 glycoside hydrolase family 43 protein [Halalkalibacterium halodurans]